MHRRTDSPNLLWVWETQFSQLAIRSTTVLARVVRSTPWGIGETGCSRSSQVAQVILRTPRTMRLSPATAGLSPACWLLAAPPCRRTYRT